MILLIIMIMALILVVLVVLTEGMYTSTNVYVKNPPLSTCLVGMVLKTFIKDPDAVLDYAFDWTEWLQSSETISVYTISIGAGIIKDSDSETNGIVTVWLSGGTDGETYEVACKITTGLGRTDERTAMVEMSER